VVLSRLLPPLLCPFADILGGVRQLVDLVEDWYSKSNSEHPVTPDPLVLNVVLEGELCHLRGEGVRELHRARWSLRRHGGGFYTAQKSTKNNVQHYVMNTNVTLIVISQYALQVLGT
jgi:hypothetical protein